MSYGQVLKKYEQDPSFFYEEREVKELKENEVLLDMQYAMVNPSDLAFIQGEYGFKKKLPVVAGFEGSGTVKAVGPAVSTLNIGDRVAATAEFRGDGAWATQMITSEDNCFKLLDDISYEQGARLIVNPLTVEGLLAAAGDAKAIVHTAAASSLGRMLAPAAKKAGKELIAVVRRPEQAEIMQKLGVEQVIDTSEQGYPLKFKKAVKKSEATCLLDAVAGDLAAQLWEEMPYGSELISYGALSESSIPVNPGRAIFQGKKVSGFWLTSWLAQSTAEERVQAAQRAQQAMLDTYEKEDLVKVPLKELSQAIKDYRANMTGAKPLITMA